MTPQKTGPWTVVVACGLALALTHARVGAQEAQIEAPDGAKVRLTMGKQTTAPLEVRALFVDLDALKRLSRVLDELDDITDHAAGWKCPDIDVNQMRRIMQAVAQTEVLLQRYRMETTQGRDIGRKHYRDLASKLAGNERALARMQRLYAWQDFFTNVGKLMLDMIDVTSLGNDILTEITAGASKLSPDGQVAAVLRVANWASEGQQAVAAAYSQGSSLAGGADAQEAPTDLAVVVQASQEYLSYVNSVLDWAKAEQSLENAKSALKFARSDNALRLRRLAPGELRKLERDVAYLTENVGEFKRGIKANVATALLTVAQAYAESLRAEMADRIKEQEEILPAEQSAMSGTFREWQRWASADAAIERVLEHAQRTQAALELVHGAYFPPASYPVPAEGTYQTAGEALRRLNSVLPPRVLALAEAMHGFRVDRPIEPQLRLDKVSVKPGEQVTVHFRAPGCLGSEAWVGLVPAAVPHGTSETSDRQRVGPRRFLGKQKDGTVTFTAPETPGRYEARMHDTVIGGLELTDAPFTVEGQSEPFTRTERLTGSQGCPANHRSDTHDVHPHILDVPAVGCVLRAVCRLARCSGPRPAGARVERARRHQGQALDGQGGVTNTRSAVTSRADEVGCPRHGRHHRTDYGRGDDRGSRTKRHPPDHAYQPGWLDCLDAGWRQTLESLRDSE